MGWTGHQWFMDGFRQKDVRNYLDDHYFFSGYEVLKSTVRRSEDNPDELVWYAAVRDAEERGDVFALVVCACLEGDEIYIKDLDETMDPNECACPETILRMLSPTSSRPASEWRERCHRNNVDMSWRRRQKPGSSVVWTVDVRVPEFGLGDRVELHREKVRLVDKTRVAWVAATDDGRRVLVADRLLNPRNCSPMQDSANDGIAALSASAQRRALGEMHRHAVTAPMQPSQSWNSGVGR